MEVTRLGDTLAFVRQPPQTPTTRRLAQVAACAFLATLAGVLASCTPPPPSALIALLDCSASFQPQRPVAVAWLKQAQAALEPRQDSVTVFRLADEVHWLYGSERQGSKTFAAALNSYLEVTPGALGTALGEGLARGVEEAQLARARKQVPHVVLLTDGEAEGGRLGANLDEASVGKAYQNFPPQAHLYLLFVHPKPADRLRRLLLPILGPRLHLHTQEACRQGLHHREFLQHLKGSPP